MFYFFYFATEGASKFGGALFLIQLVVCYGDFLFYSLIFCVDTFCFANESFSYKQSLMTPLTGAVYLSAWVILEMSLMGWPFFYSENSTLVSSILPIYSKYSAILVILVLPYTYRIIYFTLFGDSLDLPIIITPILCIRLKLIVRMRLYFIIGLKEPNLSQDPHSNRQAFKMDKISSNLLIKIWFLLQNTPIMSFANSPCLNSSPYYFIKID